MAKSISIIELDYHSEVLKYLIQVISEIDDSHFNIFTSEEIIHRTGALTSKASPNICFYIKNAGQTKEAFIESNIELINESSLVYFNTLVSDSNIYLKHSITTRKCLRIHNSNSYLNPNLSYNFVPDLLLLYKDFSYYVRKVLFRSELNSRKKHVGMMDYFVFSSDKTLEYAKLNYPEFSEKFYPKSLPIVYCEHSEKSSHDSKKTVITIIGTVDRRRRNYQQVINAIEITKSKEHTPLEFHFLGSPISKNGHSIIKKLKSLKSKGINIVTYNKFIENSTFEAVINMSDFILIPLKKNVKFTLFKETYSKTKISGNVNDAIRFGKPAIINSDYELDEQVSSSFIRFENELQLANLFCTINHFKEKKPDYTFYNKTNIVQLYKNAFNHMCQ